MRNQWYGDGRDLIKWGVLIQLAKEKNLKQILQVAYLRPNDSCPRINCGQNDFPLPREVCEHFGAIHNIRDIQRLALRTGIHIRIFGNSFDAKDTKSRACYTQEACDDIRAESERPMLVFLDPDTGIVKESKKTNKTKKGRADPKRVTSEEVNKIWKVLKTSDCLVLYQHFTREKDWVKKKREEFEEAIGSKNVKTCCARRGKKDLGAKDVVFYCVQKG